MIPDEEEVLILPFSVFQIKNRITKSSNTHSSMFAEIDLEECEQIGLEEYQQIDYPKKINQTWKQYGTTKAGGHGRGDELNQLSIPLGMYIDDDQTIYVADSNNHRIVEWKRDAIHGTVVAGENGKGSGADQLNFPVTVVVDKQNDSLIICDAMNQRMVRWPRRNGTSGETLILDIGCYDLIIDNEGYLYVSDWSTHEIRRWKIGETNGIIVAGGNGKGNGSNHLNFPTYIFVDEDHSVYVSDSRNDRVMKWVKGAKQGTVVAVDGQDIEEDSELLSNLNGIIGDPLGSIYVVNRRSHGVIRWLKGAKQGTIIVGGNGEGNESNQLNYPTDLSFDRQNNLYVLDTGNHRIQKFDIN